MNDNILMIAVTEAKAAAENETTLEGRLRAAMAATKDHWMVTGEDDRFRSAVAGALLLSNEDDKDRIKREMDQLRTLNAAISGVPVNFDAIKPLENPVGLMKMWREVKGRERRKSRAQFHRVP